MSNRMWTEEGNLGMCGGLGLRLALGPRLGAWGWALAGRGGRGGETLLRQAQQWLA